MAPTASHRRATLDDATYLAPLLREADIQELALASGETPLAALRLGVESSDWCEAGTVDGEAVALFGVTYLDPERATIGVPWMLGSQRMFDAGTISMCKIALKAVGWMHADYDHLVNMVSAANTVHIQWLAWLGFRFTVLHPRYGKGRVPFLQFERHLDV